MPKSKRYSLTYSKLHVNLHVGSVHSIQFSWRAWQSYFLSRHPSRCVASSYILCALKRVTSSSIPPIIKRVTSLSNAAHCKLRHVMIQRLTVKCVKSSYIPNRKLFAWQVIQYNHRAMQERQSASQSDVLSSMPYELVVQPVKLLHYGWYR